MNAEAIQTLASTFEASAQQTETGVEYWLARDLQNLLGYDEWRNFTAVGDSLRIGFARTGDVFLTHKGSVGLVAIVPEVPDYVMLTPQVTYYRTNPAKLSNSYLKYAFQAPFFRDQLNSFSAQSTRPYIGITGCQRDSWSQSGACLSSNCAS